MGWNEIGKDELNKLTIQIEANSAALPFFWGRKIFSMTMARFNNRRRANE